MNNTLIIDSREPSFIKEMAKSFFEEYIKEPIPFTVEELYTCDFKYNNILIERKEIHDFCNSIIEGRLSSQKYKMGEALHDDYHVYLIVYGSLSDVFKGKISKRSYANALASLNEHGIHTINLENEDMTLFFETIYAIIRQYNSDKPLRKPFLEPEETNYCKKCLMCIDGIGEEMASNIIKQYSPNLKSYFQVRPDVLHEGLLKVNGIGHKKATKIVETLYQEVEK